MRRRTSALNIRGESSPGGLTEAIKRPLGAVAPTAPTGSCVFRSISIGRPIGAGHALRSDLAASSGKPGRTRSARSQSSRVDPDRPHEQKCQARTSPRRATSGVPYATQRQPHAALRLTSPTNQACPLAWRPARIEMARGRGHSSRVLKSAGAFVRFSPV